MPLPDPKLDDRRFQDLVDEAKSLIPRYCPEWTDHNVSDPGVTLIELFAWMTDVLLYRVNRVPEKNYIRFLDMLGIRLRGAVPARTAVTFWFSAPQETTMSVPRGTEVATVRSETQQAVVFTTDEALDVPVPGLAHALTTPDGEKFADQTAKLGLEAEFFPVFGAPPVVGNSLYLGFESELSRCVLRLQAECRLEGVGVDPLHPPLVWEAWCGDEAEWVVADVDRDGTGGLNKSGAIVLHLPRDMALREVNGEAAYWVRLRLVETVDGQKPYSDSPEMSTLLAASLGGSAMATHAQVVEREMLGRSTGKPGQTFSLHQHPVLARQEGETLEVENEDTSEYEPWEEVATFADSEPDDRHYSLDSASGEIEFGPRIRQPDGTERPYGSTPAKSRLVRMRAYRFGGGVVGNVGANALTVLKSSIPYVARVQNRHAAVGGLDAERIESAKLRAPLALRARNRAVTAEDFEYLSRQASQSVARARCLPSAASGGVDVLIVPSVLGADDQRRLESLSLPPELREEVERFLDDRRLITTRLRVDMPAYIGVSVDAEVVVKDHVDPVRVESEVVRALRRHMDPLSGGPDAGGWPFGRDLYQSELLAEIQKVDGVEFVRSMTMTEVDPRTGEERSRPGTGSRDDLIELPEDALLLPQELRIQCVSRLALGG